MTRSNCIFCRIVAREVPSVMVFESDDFIAIRDIQPQAKVHLLVIPRVHVECLDADGAVEVNEKIVNVAVDVARSEGLTAHGFRVVMNNRQWGGQTVAHLHLHLLGGEPLRGHFA